MNILSKIQREKVLLYYLFWIVFYNFLPAIYIDYSDFSEATQSLAIVYSIMGSVSFVIGYLIYNRFANPKYKVSKNTFMSENYILVYIITIVLFLFVGSVFKLIFSIISGYVIIKLYNRKKFHYLIVVFLITILNLMFDFTRMYLLSFILTVFLYYYFNTKRLYVIQIVIFAMISMTVLILMREYRQYQKIDTEKVNDYYIENAEVSNIFKAMDTYHTYYVYLFALDYFPENKDYYYGMSVVKPFLFFIPRDIWKNKPVNITNEIPSYVYGSTKSDIYSSGLTILGEFYVNFGMIGIIVMSFIFGAISNRLKLLFFYGNEFQKLIAISYIVIFPSLMRGGISTTITTFIFLYVFYKLFDKIRPIRFQT